MNTPFLVIITCFFLGAYLSTLVSDYFAIRFLRKILVPPEDETVKHSFLPESGDKFKPAMFGLTKKIGELSFKFSLSMVIIVTALSFPVFDLFELIITAPLFNLLFSSFSVVAAMVHKPFFASLVYQKKQ